VESSTDCSIKVAVVKLPFRMNFPKSFSPKNKAFISPQEIALILESLKQFELDTHVEIVLLGFQNEIGKLVENHLSYLSGLPSLKRHLHFLKEKLIFRVSVSKFPEKASISNDTFWETEDFITQLKIHHRKSAAKTSLFILNIPKDYNGFAALPSTIVSPSGFAVINWSAVSASLNELDFQSVSQIQTHNNMETPEIAKISVLIYRSIEQIIPEVRPKTSNFTIHRDVTVRILVLCGFPLKKCIPDTQLTSVFESLSHSLRDSTFLRFQYGVSVISITDSVTITHAILASLGKYSSSWNSKHQNFSAKFAVHAPENLLELLLHSAEVTEILQKDSSTLSPNGILVPVFSLLLPDDIDAIFPSPTTSPLEWWYLSPTLSVSSTSKAMALLRPASLAEYSRGSLKHSIQYGTNLWSRSNGLVEIKRDAAFERRDLFDKILAMVWEITPSHLYFSPSDQQYIQEDLWLDAYSVTIDTFRDHQVVYRQLIIHVSEQLLNRLSNSLIFHQSVSIAGDASILRENILATEKFEVILKDFDHVASDFSHLQYDLALKTLEGIERNIAVIEEGLWDSNFAKQQFYLNCRTFESEEFQEQTATLRLNSGFRMSVVFVGLVSGFLMIAAFFQFYHFNPRRGVRRVIR
jgi:hypothetical protein